MKNEQYKEKVFSRIQGFFKDFSRISWFKDFSRNSRIQIPVATNYLQRYVDGKLEFREQKSHKNHHKNRSTTRK